MLYTDGDAWPCRDNYIETLCRPPFEDGIDFSAAKLTEITHSSAVFPEWTEYTRPTLVQWLLTLHPDDPAPSLRVIFHSGPFKFFSTSILHSFIDHCSDQPPLHDEVAISTYLHHLGAILRSYEDYKVFDTDRWLRYRPGMSQLEFQEALDKQIPLVHPVKNNGWIFQLHNCRHRNNTTRS